jgi:hypothetical protein
MTTPQQFLESFFQEKVAIYNDANVRLLPVYAKYFGEPLSKRSRDFLLLDRMPIHGRFLLARTGLPDGRKATSNKRVFQQVRTSAIRGPRARPAKSPWDFVSAVRAPV